MGKYALGCAFNMSDIFMNLPLKKLKISCKECYDLISECHRNKLAIRIFRECVRLVLDDIVENNVTFWFPLTGARKCNMHMKRVDGVAFKNLRRGGKWKDVDIFKSYFTGYEIRLFMLGNRTPREKSVYVDKHYRDIITANTNAGMSYGDGKIDTHLSDYLDKMYSLFPDVPKQDVKRILSFGWKSLYLHNSYGGDTIITGVGLWCYIGRLKKKPLDHFYYYIRKLTVKLRVMYRRKKIPWNGYYYFALSTPAYERYLAQKNKRGRPKKYFDFGPVFLYEILDECKINEGYRGYVFRVPFISKVRMKWFTRNLRTDKAELILIREPMKFKDLSVYENKYAVL